MNRGPKEKFATLYDTAKKCLLILDHLYNDLEKGISLVNVGNNIENDPSIVIGVYISALGLVDYSHRFNEIVSAMPLIRNDQPELRSLKKSLETIKQCRNYLQHMRGDLMNNDYITYPILGAISWMHDGRNYMLFSNQATQNFSVPGIAYDRYEEQYICKYMLIVGGHEIKIDTVYTEIKSFWTWLEIVAVIEPANIKNYVWGKPTILYSQITSPNKANSADARKPRG